jgi:tetratricopeptide repeat protein
LNNIATLCRSENRLDEAAKLYRRSLSIFKRVLDPDHPNLVACAANYGRLLEEIEK